MVVSLREISADCRILTCSMLRLCVSDQLGCHVSVLTSILHIQSLISSGYKAFLILSARDWSEEEDGLLGLHKLGRLRRQ